MPTDLELSIEEAVRNKLVEGAPGVTFYPTRLPARVNLPSCTINLISDPDDMTHEGPSAYRAARIQLGIIGATYESMKIAAQAIRRGLLGPFGSWSGVKVQSLVVQQEFDAPEPAGAATGTFRRVLELLIEYTRIQENA